MSSKNWDTFLSTCVALYYKDIIKQFCIYISGGEPTLAFEDLKDVVYYYYIKYPQIFKFFFVSNMTILPGGFIEWAKKTKMKIAISLDSLHFSKPLLNGKSSSSSTLKNIKILLKSGIGVDGISTVLDISKRNSLKDIARYISKNNFKWKLAFPINFPYSDKKVNQCIKIICDALSYLKKKNYPLSLFDFSGIDLSREDQTNVCDCGSTFISVYPDLTVSYCNNGCSTPKLGNFDINILNTLATNPLNKYHYNQTVLERCNSCFLLNKCHGGCKEMHKYPDYMEKTCKVNTSVIKHIQELWGVV